MRTARLSITILFGLLLAAWGCEHSGPIEAIDTGGGPATLSQIQAGIFDARCAVPSCHVDGSNAPFGLDLSEGQAYGNLVGQPSGWVPAVLRVKAGDPDSSFVMWKITDDPRKEGERMPFGGDMLSDSDIDAIRGWIADGAPDN